VQIEFFRSLLDNPILASLVDLSLRLRQNASAVPIVQRRAARPGAPDKSIQWNPQLTPGEGVSSIFLNRPVGPSLPSDMI
jgi:hypothetical protein